LWGGGGGGGGGGAPKATLSVRVLAMDHFPDENITTVRSLRNEHGIVIIWYNCRSADVREVLMSVTGLPTGVIFWSAPSFGRSTSNVNAPSPSRQKRCQAY